MVSLTGPDSPDSYVYQMMMLLNNHSYKTVKILTPLLKKSVRYNCFFVIYDLHLHNIACNDKKDGSWKIPLA